MRRPDIQDTRRLVLVGGGHTHIQVLKRFAMDPPPGVRTTVVVDTPIAVYSGMVPGFVSGQYRAEELEIDVLPLARLAGARVILARAVGLDPRARRLALAGRPEIEYDLVSFDIGSTVGGLDTPGVREHALPTRPIGRFVGAVEARLAELERCPGAPCRVVVVGAGAGGVELAFTLRERLAREGAEPRVTLLEAASGPLPGASPRLASRVARAAAARGIEIVPGVTVDAVEEDAVLAGGRRVPSDLTVWVAGAAPNPALADAGLPTDDRGFLRTDPTLRVMGHDDIFAVGDCGSPAAHPWVPKAGVYAVRQGPALVDNLRSALAAGGLVRRYRPQRDFLTLLNLGDGTAIGAKWGLSFEGRWVFRWKDRIDRAFMRRYRILGEDDAVTAEFAPLAGMRDRMDILCGGCAAKLGQGALERALERLGPGERAPAVELGIEEGDDAAAVVTPTGTRVVSSVDQFRGFTDDPFLVGRVGAVNAASDILAKGISPEIAQAIIALPESAPPAEREDLLLQVLAGARRALDDLGVSLVGGHTTTASELLVGFLVEAFAGPDERLLALSGLESGATLILTKPLGTGVLFHADMKGRLRGRWFEAAVESMLRPNDGAARIARSFGATAATDVTGFGLARHLAGMLRASDLAADVDVRALPRLPGAGPLLAAGLRSTFHDENERAAPGIEFAPEARDHENLPLLFDPQTSGGLLFGVSPAAADDVLAALVDAGYGGAAAIGSTRPASLARLRVVAGP